MPPTPRGQSTSKGPKRVPGGNGERGAEREGFEDIARQRANLLPSSSNRNPAFVRTVMPVTGRLSRDEPGPDSPRPFWVEARFFAHRVDPAARPSPAGPSRRSADRRREPRGVPRSPGGAGGELCGGARPRPREGGGPGDRGTPRSEERRVGKECRSRWSP